MSIRKSFAVHSLFYMFHKNHFILFYHDYEKNLNFISQYARALLMHIL